MNAILAADGLTIGGWFTMVMSVGFVTGLFAWCIWRVVRAPDASEHMHSQMDIETPDVERE